MTYEQSLTQINSMIKNIAQAFSKHPDEVFVDLSEME